MTGTKLGVDLTVTNTDITKAGGRGGGHGLGDRHCDETGNKWVFVIASNTSITQYDAVVIKNAYDISQLALDGSAKVANEVGFAQVAFAPNEYGWVMTHGRPVVRLAADTDASLPLYATATGGVLDGVTTTSMQIQGLIAINSVTNAITAQACVATYPQCYWLPGSLSL